MATKAYTSPLGWHEGEEAMHQLLHVPEYDNPSSFGLSPHAQRLLRLSSMLAIGTLDDEGRPWTTLLGGEPGCAISLGGSVVGVKCIVGTKHDPVVEAVTHQDGKGKILSALGIHLETRDRVKLSGRLLGGGLVDSEPQASSFENEEKDAGAAELHMAFAVERSLGNCPKYLNKKTLIPVTPNSTLISTSLPLCNSAVALLAKADTFFLSTSNHNSNMGTNHRGGSPGFVRVERNSPTHVTLVYPEYSGNRLYQTLGNLSTTPRAGLVFPDFDSGDVLYLTGTTEITYGPAAAAVLPRSNLLVRIHVTATRFVRSGLAFRGSAGEASPYNPPVVYLACERDGSDVMAASSSSEVHATLVAREMLTPTIARFRFTVENLKTSWTAGQYVALAFAEELDIGYSHMRDDDPRSLNDDFVRTFTVSSAPPPAEIGTGTDKIARINTAEFEITVRNVGTVTNFLFRHNIRAGLTVPLLGFGGSFQVAPGDKEDNDDGSVTTPFIAGGIGITPLLPYLSSLSPATLRLYWTVNIRDLGLVLDTWAKHPALAASTHLFISGASSNTTPSSDSDAKALLQRIDEEMGGGGKVQKRRIQASDLESDLERAQTWYLCTSPALRKDLLVWLKGKKCVYEDFGY